MSNPFVPGVGGILSADIAVPEHDLQPEVRVVVQGLVLHEGQVHHLDLRAPNVEGLLAGLPDRYPSG